MPAIGLEAAVSVVFGSEEGLIRARGDIVEQASFGRIDLSVNYDSQAACGNGLVTSTGSFASNFSDSSNVVRRL